MVPSGAKPGLLNGCWRLHQDIGWRDLPGSCCCNSRTPSFKAMKALIDVCTALDPESLAISGHGCHYRIVKLISPDSTMTTVLTRCSLSIN